MGQEQSNSQSSNIHGMKNGPERSSNISQDQKQFYYNEDSGQITNNDLALRPKPQIMKINILAHTEKMPRVRAEFEKNKHINHQETRISENFETCIMDENSTDGKKNFSKLQKEMPSNYSSQYFKKSDKENKIQLEAQKNKHQRNPIISGSSMEQSKKINESSYSLHTRSNSAYFNDSAVIKNNQTSPPHKTINQGEKNFASMKKQSSIEDISHDVHNILNLVDNEIETRNSGRSEKIKQLYENLQEKILDFKPEIGSIVDRNNLEQKQSNSTNHEDSKLSLSNSERASTSTKRKFNLTKMNKNLKKSEISSTATQTALTSSKNVESKVIEEKPKKCQVAIQVEIPSARSNSVSKRTHEISNYNSCGHYCHGCQIGSQNSSANRAYDRVYSNYNPYSKPYGIQPNFSAYFSSGYHSLPQSPAKSQASNNYQNPSFMQNPTYFLGNENFRLASKYVSNIDRIHNYNSNLKFNTNKSESINKFLLDATNRKGCRSNRLSPLKSDHDRNLNDYKILQYKDDLISSKLLDLNTRVSLPFQTPKRESSISDKERDSSYDRLRKARIEKYITREKDKLRELSELTRENKQTYEKTRHEISNFASMISQSNNHSRNASFSYYETANHKSLNNSVIADNPKQLGSNLNRNNSAKSLSEITKMNLNGLKKLSKVLRNSSRENSPDTYLNVSINKKPPLKKNQSFSMRSSPIKANEVKKQNKENSILNESQSRNDISLRSHNRDKNESRSKSREKSIDSIKRLNQGKRAEVPYKEMIERTKKNISRASENDKKFAEEKPRKSKEIFELRKQKIMELDKRIRENLSRNKSRSSSVNSNN